jgi:hypothetical protein
MARHFHKRVGITIKVPEVAKATLDRQATARGLSTSIWAGQVFDIGFAAICARERSMPITDADLDAIVGATLLLCSRDWNTAAIATGLGVSEETIARILDGWRDYRRAA